MDCWGNSKQGLMLLTVLTVSFVFFSVAVADSDLTTGTRCHNWGPICTFSCPPLCQCDDLLLACPPTCKWCEMTKTRFYKCRDLIVNDEVQCTPEPTLRQQE